MTDYERCGFEECEQPVTTTVRFELADPTDPGQTMGTFLLPVCQEHSRSEFGAELAPG